MIARLEAADSRIQTLVAFIATVSLAMPTIATALKLNLSFGSYWFLAAMVVAVIAVLVGIVMRSVGIVTLLHPTMLYQKWLHKEKWQFQKDALYFAGQHFDANAARIRLKAKALLWMTIFFVLELALLLLWIGNV